MKNNHSGIPNTENSQPVSAQARLLMSQSRQKLQNRQQSMLQRVASKVGIDA